MQQTETVSFTPGQKPTDLDQQTFCARCLSGRPDYFVSQEELDAWRVGQALSRHQAAGIPQIVHYDAVSARQRAAAGTNLQCIRCGRPRQEP